MTTLEFLARHTEHRGITPSGFQVFMVPSKTIWGRVYRVHLTPDAPLDSMCNCFARKVCCHIEAAQMAWNRAIEIDRMREAWECYNLPLQRALRLEPHDCTFSIETLRLREQSAWKSWAEVARRDAVVWTPRQGEAWLWVDGEAHPVRFCEGEESHGTEQHAQLCAAAIWKRAFDCINESVPPSLNRALGAWENRFELSAHDEWPFPVAPPPCTERARHREAA